MLGKKHFIQLVCKDGRVKIEAVYFRILSRYSLVVVDCQLFLKLRQRLRELRLKNYLQEKIVFLSCVQKTIVVVLLQ